MIVSPAETTAGLWAPNANLMEPADGIRFFEFLYFQVGESVAGAMSELGSTETETVPTEVVENLEENESSSAESETAPIPNPETTALISLEQNSDGSFPPSKRIGRSEEIEGGNSGPKFVAAMDKETSGSNEEQTTGTMGFSDTQSTPSTMIEDAQNLGWREIEAHRNSRTLGLREATTSLEKSKLLRVVDRPGASAALTVEPISQNAAARHSERGIEKSGPVNLSGAWQNVPSIERRERGFAIGDRLDRLQGRTGIVRSVALEPLMSGKAAADVKFGHKHLVGSDRGIADQIVPGIDVLLREPLPKENQFLLSPFSSSASGSVTTVSTTYGHSTEAPRLIAAQLAEAASKSPSRITEVSLSPEELGRVRMVISSGESQLSVSILAERGETADLIRRHLETLTQEFRQMGYRDVSFSFGEKNGKNPQNHSSGDDLSASNQKSSEPVGESREIVCSHVVDILM